MTAATTTWTPCATCWLLLHLATPATHTGLDGARCDRHASPADVALGTHPRPVNVTTIERVAPLATPLQRMEGSGL